MPVAHSLSPSSLSHPRHIMSDGPVVASAKFPSNDADQADSGLISVDGLTQPAGIVHSLPATEIKSYSVDWRKIFPAPVDEEAGAPIDDERAQERHDLYRDEEAVR